MLAHISCCLLQLGLLFIALLFGVLLFASFVAAGPQKYPQNDPQSPQNGPQRPPKASQNSPKMTPGSTLGTPGGPKSSLFWRGSIFEAILDPKMEPTWIPKSTKSLLFFVKKWVGQPLWPYVSSPPDVFSFVGQICVYFWKAQPLKTWIFP